MAKHKLQPSLTAYRTIPKLAGLGVETIVKHDGAPYRSRVSRRSGSIAPVHLGLQRWSGGSAARAETTPHRKATANTGSPPRARPGPHPRNCCRGSDTAAGPPAGSAPAPIRPPHPRLRPEPFVQRVPLDALDHADRRIPWPDEALDTGAKQIDLGRGFRTPWFHRVICKGLGRKRQTLCLSDAPILAKP